MRGKTVVFGLLLLTFTSAASAQLVSTFAGNGESGHRDGFGGDASFSYPVAVCADPSNTLYVADAVNHVIRVVYTSGEVRTFAGAAGQRGSTDGPASAARFDYPNGIACGAGEVFVADTGNSTIRRIAGGVVTTIAGKTGIPGWTDGRGTGARFGTPTGIVRDLDGTLYVADTTNHTLRRIAPDLAVVTVAGSYGEAGNIDGRGADARLSNPRGLTIDSSGNVFIADMENDAIRVFRRDGTLQTLAGGKAAGARDGTLADAQFNKPVAIARLSDGFLVVDGENHTIRRISDAGEVTTVAGASLLRGFDDGPALSARFDYPYGIAVDGRERVYIADMSNHAIRMLDSKSLRRRGIRR